MGRSPESQPAPVSPHVETAGPEDRIAISHLNVWAYREYAFDLGPESWPELVAALTAPGDTGFFVIRAGGGLVGSVAYRPAGTSPAPIPAGWASLDRLAVAPDRRGEGLGRRLVTACLEQARREGAPAVGARVESYMTAAQGLLGDLGFHREQGLARRGAPGYWLYRKEL